MESDKKTTKKSTSASGNKKRTSRSSGASAKKKKKTVKRSVNAKKQAEYIRFMFLTVIIAVVICVAIFFVVFSSMNNNKTEKTTSSSVTTKTTQGTTEDFSEFDTETMAVVKEVDYRNQIIKVYDIEKDTNLTLMMSAGATMKNQYGNTMSLAEFKKGDIVQLEYNTKQMKYSTLKISAKAWSRNSITGFKLDTEKSTITIGNNTYKYNDMLLVTYKDFDFDVEMLNSIDVITMKGYSDTLWTLEVEKSHGLVTFENADKVVNGTIELNTNIFKNLEEGLEITVSEGNHSIVVKGENIETYTKEFTVSSAEKVVINLEEAGLRKGNLFINSNVSNYEIYIDGERKNYGEAITLDYGSYEVTLSKDGYESFTKNVIIDKAKVIAEINLEEKESVKMGKLTIDTGEVTGAKAYVDNVYIGDTPVELKVSYGEHRITVKKDGYEDFTLSVNIDDNPRKVVITMHTKVEDITVTSPIEVTTEEESTTFSGISVKPIY